MQPRGAPCMPRTCAGDPACMHARQAQPLHAQPSRSWRHLPRFRPSRWRHLPRFRPSRWRHLPRLRPSRSRLPAKPSQPLHARDLCAHSDPACLLDGIMRTMQSPCTQRVVHSVRRKACFAFASVRLFLPSLLRVCFTPSVVFLPPADSFAGDAHLLEVVEEEDALALRAAHGLGDPRALPSMTRVSTRKVSDPGGMGRWVWDGLGDSRAGGRAGGRRAGWEQEGGWPAREWRKRTTPWHSRSALQHTLYMRGERYRALARWKG